jgi:hypothetical protein
MDNQAQTSTIIARSDLVVSRESGEARIKNFQHLASYNWIEARTATVAIPGCPAAWNPPRYARKLPQDHGRIFIAQNAARHPQYPLEPLFRALDIEKPDVDFSEVDVISDRNNIRKLLSFIDAGSSQRSLEAFTIKAQLIGQSVVLNRDEAKTEEFLGPNDFRGFGHEFEKAYTQEEVAGSTGHHRIISYDFQDLKMIIRFETDAYVRSTAADDGLESLLENLKLSSTAKPHLARSHKPVGSSLTIEQHGHCVPSNSILEIKTRVKHKPLEWSETAAQLWVSQTPNIVKAYHQRGVFEVPKVESVIAQLERWETMNQDSLRKLAVLLKKIVAHVKIYDKAVIRYSELTGRLSITQTRDVPNLIPEDLIEAWMPVVEVEAVSEEENYDSVDNTSNGSNDQSENEVSVLLAT